MTDKTCPRCLETKDPGEFYVNNKHRDKLSTYCKPCAIAKQRELYISHPREKLAPDGFKRCPKCETIKPINEFGKNRSNYDGLQPRCKPCSVEAVTESRRNNPTAHRESSRRWAQNNRSRQADNNLRWRIGAEPGTYDRLFAEQGGKCAICGTDNPGDKAKRFHMDHCHVSRVVRGLLCSRCNTGIGQLRHDVNLALAAAAYLEKHAAIPTHQVKEEVKADTDSIRQKN